jgi:hypothetical protein
MPITVMKNGVRKEFLEMLTEEREQKRKDRNSIRHVLLAVKIMRANFPPKLKVA